MWGLGISIAIAMAIGLILFVELGLPQFLIWLGMQDRWWSPLRLKPSSGQYVIVAKGDKEGPFDRIIHSVPGFHLDSENNFVEGEAPETEAETYLSRLGLEWVGFNKAFFRKPTEYAAWEKLPGKAEYGLVAKERNKDEKDPYYFFQYVMAVKAEGAETEDNFPVDMVMVITVRHRNPVKVHFFGGKWTVRAEAAVESAARQYASDKKFNDLRIETTHRGQGPLVKLLKELGDVPPNTHADPENLTAKFGLEIDDPNFVKMDITPGSEADKIAKATAAKGIATLEAEEIDIRAKAEAGRIRERYGAIAQIPGGAGIALAEAIEKSHPQTIVLGNSSIAIPSSP